MTARLPLMTSVLTLLAKSVLILLGLSFRNFYHLAYGLGTTALIISNEEMKDTMKILKSFEESGLLIKGIIETIKNEAKEIKADFFQYY